ncbi:MAG: glycosyltransferase [Candidatus Woesebacteria bacterium]|jgi:glycosyltransferase involved in cell wall biosynthesis
MNQARTIKVLHFSPTSQDNCGVGKYQEAFVESAADLPVQNDFFDVSPYRTRNMSPEELGHAINHLADVIKDYDILHIQHEFGLFWHDEIIKAVEVAKLADKKVVFTIHLSPGFVKELHPVRLHGLGPRSWVNYLRQSKHHNLKMSQHIQPMMQADLLIVHNQATLEALKELGVDSSKIKEFAHPVLPITNPPKTNEVKKWLSVKDGDVVMCMAGFLHKYKGTLAAVKALKFLPKNYKLLLAGSVKGDSNQVSYEDKVADAIYKYKLQDRVYITGYIESDERLNSLIRECDVCVFPYDRVYYASASSGALGLAFANCMPVVAYPTESFKEAAQNVKGSIALCETFSYYELAREVKKIDTKKQSELSKEYAQKLSWSKSAKKIVEFYKELA